MNIGQPTGVVIAPKPRKRQMEPLPAAPVPEPAVAADQPVLVTV